MFNWISYVDGSSKLAKRCLNLANASLYGLQVPLVQGWGRQGVHRKERLGDK